MKIQFQCNGEAYESDSAEGTSIAIPLDFSGPQPNHFGAPKAEQKPLRLGGFTGDTRQGGSCNVDTLIVIPHCNGTHTESVGHIVNEDVYVGHQTGDAFLTTALITLKPERWQLVETKQDSYRPPLAGEDWVITRKQLQSAMQDAELPKTDALIIRTISPLEKKSVAYGEANPPAFLTVEAMQWVVEQEYRHLLLDLPSVDRMYDDGLLTNHHLFWLVPEGSHELHAESRQDKTITEMVLVPEQVADGFYLMNLQVPALCTDAAPSKPVLFPAKSV
ncbi:MAG: cyclase family protein [Pirellulaceae bacterium]|nr:cyclase family protein [Pirellulaceae bacterium]